MTRLPTRFVLRGGIMFLAMLVISGPVHRERERIMIEFQEFQAAFDAAMRERGDNDEFYKLAALCKRSPVYLDYLRHEARSTNPRKALLAEATRFWIEKPLVFKSVIRYLTRQPPADVYPPGKELSINASGMPWRVKALVKHVGAEAIIPLLELVARLPEAEIAYGARSALSEMWDASLMDRPLFTIFSDPSYSDLYRVDIAQHFAKRSSQPYAATLRQMLADRGLKHMYRRNIIEILADLRDSESIPLLRRALFDHDADGQVRGEALDALDRLGAPDVLDISLRVFPSLHPGTDDDYILFSAIGVFSNHGDERVIPLLEPLWRNRKGWFDNVGLDAGTAIERIRERLKTKRGLDASTP
jgi:HEAT repeat protein